MLFSFGFLTGFYFCRDIKYFKKKKKNSKHFLSPTNTQQVSNHLNFQSSRFARRNLKNSKQLADVSLGATESDLLENKN